ncbi:hypothetical protein SSPIM334S_07052 [Streptomyces spiroverticillatus]
MNRKTVGAASRNSQTPASDASSCVTKSMSTVTNSAATVTSER